MCSKEAPVFECLEQVKLAKSPAITSAGCSTLLVNLTGLDVRSCIGS